MDNPALTDKHSMEIPNTLRPSGIHPCRSFSQVRVYSGNGHMTYQRTAGFITDVILWNLFRIQSIKHKNISHQCSHKSNHTYHKYNQINNNIQYIMVEITSHRSFTQRPESSGSTLASTNETCPCLKSLMLISHVVGRMTNDLFSSCKHRRIHQMYSNLI